MRIPNALFSHTLAANFDGYDVWGKTRYRIATNSTGFKDAAVRHVAANGDSRRVVLIGDSFTEGLGVTFEQTGQQRSEKTEFLNAAVTSYSPTLYYRKIKFLLDSSLKFDELVVLPDLSDVQDEATSYFCFDDDPEYGARCPRTSEMLSRNFHLSNRLRQLIKLRLALLSEGASWQDISTPREGGNRAASAGSPPIPVSVGQFQAMPSAANMRHSGWKAASRARCNTCRHLPTS